MSEGTTDNGPGRCPVHGCLLPGSIKSGQSWKCAFHHGASVGEYAGITARMSNRRTALEIGLSLVNANYGESPTASDLQVARDLGISEATGAWSKIKLGRAIMSKLREECRQPQAQTGLGAQGLKSEGLGRGLPPEGDE